MRKETYGIMKIALCVIIGVLLMRSDAWGKEAPFDSVWIPGGEFVMGSDQTSSPSNERPAHRV